MKHKLGDIAKIQFGLYEKNKVEGDTKYLLAQHFNEAGQLTDFKESYIDITVENQRYLLEDNDVLLTGKGFRNFAWLYKRELGQAIASSLFFVIKPKKETILPAYLVLLFNSLKMQHHFKVLGSMTTIPSISKKELLNITIEVPPIKKQLEVIEMAKLIDKEIQLSKEIITKKEAMKKALITEMISEKTKT